MFALKATIRRKGDFPIKYYEKWTRFIIFTFFLCYIAPKCKEYLDYIKTINFQTN